MILKKSHAKYLLTVLAVFSVSFLFTLPVFAVSINGPNKFTPEIFVLNYGADYASILKGITVTAPIVYVGNYPNAVGYDSANNRIYIGSLTQNTVSVLDASNNAVLGVITSVASPQSITYSPINDILYVAEYYQNDMALINPNTNEVVSSTPVTCPNSAIFNPVTQEVYVTNFCTDTVTAVPSTGTPTSITVQNNPQGLAFDSVNNDTYVANFGSNSISIINSKNNVIKTMNGFNQPYGAAFDPSNGDIYVANNGNGTVSVISSGNALVGTAIAVGSSPEGVTFNPANNEIYIANSGSASISIIKGTKVLTTVTSTYFNEPYLLGAS